MIGEKWKSLFLNTSTYFSGRFKKEKSYEFKTMHQSIFISTLILQTHNKETYFFINIYSEDVLGKESV